ncbi:MAG: hypothetical protein LiPW15_89 [Parcubacteria group bacterium LiPW_15]|nr:MAG: hypothetical protein LiPW15_89 [Parcubacteria group bacterium LiPW_15]
MTQYSEPLIVEITRIFKRDYNLVLSRDQALEYLDDLVDFFLAFYPLPSESARESRPPKAGGIPSPDLIYPHSC